MNMTKVENSIRSAATALAMMTLSSALAPTGYAQSQSSAAQTPKAQQVQLSGRPQGNASATIQQSGTGSTSSSVNTVNPMVQVQGDYAGSVDAQLPGVGSVNLTFAQAIEMGLRYNLGGLSSDASSRQSRAQRLSALSSLLPNIYATLSENAAKTNLQTQGLRRPPSVGEP